MKSQYIKIICMQFISTIKIEKLSLNQIWFQIEKIFDFTHVHKHSQPNTNTPNPKIMIWSQFLLGFNSDKYKKLRLTSQENNI